MCVSIHSQIMRQLTIVTTSIAMAGPIYAGEPIVEYERNATAWMAAARCHEAYSFDQFLPGLPNATGCLSQPNNPVVLQLASGTLTVTAYQGENIYCAINDSGTSPAVSDVLINNSSSAVVFEFDPPVTAFYTYYGSLDVGRVVTMKLYANDVLMDTLVSAPSPHISHATGHGFDAWYTPIDRIEFTNNEVGGGATAIGAFVGLAANEPSLGTTTINNYSGPGGSQTVQLDFACTFQPVVQVPRVHNLTQSIGHGCIRDAIAFANNGDVLLVHPYIYHEAIDFKGKAVTIVSTDPNDPDVVEATAINAGVNDWSAVQAVSGEGPGSQLIGLKISDGRGTFAGGQKRGGGLYALDSSPTIDRCHFISNSAEMPNGFIGRGGAIYLGGTSSPVITNCSFTGNASYMGGAIYAVRGGWSVSDCTFTGNIASMRGGAISIASDVGPSDITITNCLFEGNQAANQGGAISAFDLTGMPGGAGIVVHLSETMFSNNRAGSGSTGGGIWADNMRFMIESCRFENNSTNSGAAIRLQGHGMLIPSEIRNTHFVGNSAKPGDSGGIVTIQGTGSQDIHAVIHQCVFIGNRGVRVLGVNSSTTTVSSCTFAGNEVDSSVHARIGLIYLTNSLIWDDIQPSVSESFEGNVLPTFSNLRGGGIGGQGVVNVEPHFVDPLGPDGIAGTGDEDLRLAAGSMCINAGDGAYDSKNPQFDLDGEPRHQGRIDLGAYEFPLDCNGNGIADYIEIAQGTLSDCNDNLEADFCENEMDGNCNGVLDMCEIISGALSDTNNNGMPDEFEVGGVIAGNVEWTVSNGPCIRIITQDVTITGSLTIQAGMRVRVLKGVKMTVLGGGALVVNGSASNPVEFTSTNPIPKAGDWGGIRYAPGSSGNLAHAVVKYTLGHGVRIESAPVSLLDCVITDVAGIDQPQGTSSSPAQVGGTAYGLYIIGNITPQLTRNTIERVRGGTGGRGAYAAGGGDGQWGNAASYWGNDGGNGSAAVSHGSTGVNGANGGPAYGIYCGSQTNAALTNNIVRNITGGAGGIGGGGGLGGSGGDGGAGMQCNTYVWTPVCYGGSGGNGGNAKNGGNAANGGNGADAYGIRLESSAGGAVIQNLVATISGGAGGEGGHGGRGGGGGVGGDGTFGITGSVCAASPGPGHGGDGGNAGHGGNGGLGGLGGKAYGISIGTTSSALVLFRHNTIAQLQGGSGGAAGEHGLPGIGGAGGPGGWGVKYVSPCQCVPLPIFPTNGSDGVDGNYGIPGVAGGAGTVVGVRAEGLALVNVANSILSSSDSNQSIGVTAIGSASLTLSYTLMHGFQTPFGPGTSDQGFGNVLANPMFVDAGAGDFHLLSSSPAVDSGNNSEVPIDLLHDLDGMTRIVDSDDNGSVIVDMGVYELQPGAIPCPADITGDFVVNANDLLAVINAWGICPDCAADVTGDGIVNANDLLAVINGWGPCL